MDTITSPAGASKQPSTRAQLKDRLSKLLPADTAISNLVKSNRAMIVKCLEMEHNKITKDTVNSLLTNFVNTLDALCRMAKINNDTKLAMKNQEKSCAKRIEDAKNKTYAQAIGPNNNVESETSTKHILKIFPRDASKLKSSEATKNYLINKFDINNIDANVRAIKPIGRSGISILLSKKNEIKNLKDAVEKSEDLCAKVDTKIRPSFSFIADGKDHTIEELKTRIIKKNDLLTAEAFEVVHIRKPSQHNFSIVYITIEPRLYSILKNNNFRLYLGWGATKIRECSPLTQCHNCWKFGHKLSKCRFEATGKKATRCCRCGGVNCDSNCTKALACPNCADFNNKAKNAIHPTAHTANDPTCPSRKHAEKIARERVDYGS